MKEQGTDMRFCMASYVFCSCQVNTITREERVEYLDAFSTVVFCSACTAWELVTHFV